MTTKQMITILALGIALSRITVIGDAVDGEMEWRSLRLEGQKVQVMRLPDHGIEDSWTSKVRGSIRILPDFTRIGVEWTKWETENIVSGTSSESAPSAFTFVQRDGRMVAEGEDLTDVNMAYQLLSMVSHAIRCQTQLPGHVEALDVVWGTDDRESRWVEVPVTQARAHYRYVVEIGADKKTARLFGRKGRYLVKVDNGRVSVLLVEDVLPDLTDQLEGEFFNGDLAVDEKLIERVLSSVRSDVRIMFGAALIVLEPVEE